MTVAELGQRMSSRELSEWMAYYQIEPFGEEVADLRHGIQTATMVNLQMDRKSKQVKPSDFMVTPPVQDENPLLAKFMAATDHLEVINGDDSEP